MTYNIRDFGAVGDGRANDAPAIQRAIDACSEAGGGTVLVPAGPTFLTKARTGVELGTTQTTAFPATKALAFKAGKSLKDQIA